jgi:hypothetical protein
MNADPISETAESLLPRRDAMYTPLEEAVEELHKRRRMFAGRTPGRDWLPQNEQPYAIFPRDVPTPNLEMHRFLDVTESTNLRKIVVGFSLSKFVPQNILSKSLGRMGFHEGLNRRYHPLVFYQYH